MALTQYTKRKIADLLNIRAELALKIGNLKKKSKMDVIQSRREELILDRIKTKVKILSEENIEAIWKEILNACRHVQV